MAAQAQIPIVPVVCENYHRLFDGKSRFEGGTIRIRVLPPVPTAGLKTEDVTDLTEKVRKQMLDVLIEMDRDRESFDVSSTANQPPTSTGLQGRTSLSVARNSAQDERGLGGIAGWMGMIIGTGKGKNYTKKVAKDADRLKNRGTTGQNPGDYNLVSEADRSGKDQDRVEAKATGTEEVQAGQGLLHRKTSASGNSGNSDETDEGSTVLVEAPQQ